MTTALLNVLKIKIFYSEEKMSIFVNYFAMQVDLGWITLEQVPKRYREKVRILLESGWTLQKYSDELHAKKSTETKSTSTTVTDGTTTSTTTTDGTTAPEGGK